MNVPLLSFREMVYYYFRLIMGCLVILAFHMYQYFSIRPNAFVAELRSRDSGLWLQAMPHVSKSAALSVALLLIRRLSGVWSDRSLRSKSTAKFRGRAPMGWGEQNILKHGLHSQKVMCYQAFTCGKYIAFLCQN